MTPNFGETTSGVSEVQNNVNPVGGVVTGAPGLTELGGLFDKAEQIFAGKREQADQKFLADFTNRQVMVTDGLEQGRIRTAAQARTLLRRNLSDALAANPNLQSDIVAAQRSILGLFGDSSLLSDGTIEEQRRNDRVDQLVTAGLLDENHSDAEFERADSVAQTAAQAQVRFDERMRTINLEMATHNLSDSRRSALEAERKNAAETFVRDTAPAEVDRLKSTFDNILAGAGSEAEKIQAIEDTFIAWRSQANSLVTDLDSGDFASFLKPFEMMQEAYLDRATGEVSDAETQRRIERIVDGQKLLALSDPTIANLAVASELFSDSLFQNALTSNPASLNAALRFMSGHSPTNSESDAPPPFVSRTSETQGMEAYLNEVIKGLESGNDNVREEANASMSSVMSSMEDYEGLLRRDPKTGIAVVRWMSSPAFLKAVQENPELFANNQGVRDVLESHYDSEVWGMVRNEFRENKVGVLTGETASVQTGFSLTRGAVMDDVPVLTSEGVPAKIGARATQGGMEFYAIEDGDQRGVADEVRRLNRELAPVINNTIKAGAHLEGRNDYGAMWEELAPSIMGGGTEMAGGDEGDDLSFDDFYGGIDTIDLQNDVTRYRPTMGALPNGGQMEGGGPSGVIMHHTAGHGGAAQLEQIFHDRNVSAHYVVERDGTIVQMLPDNVVGWHAGVRNNSGYDNKNTVGIEVVAMDDSDVTPEQVQAAKALTLSLSERYGFDPMSDVFGHGEVAPGHKQATEGMTIVSQIRENG